MDEVKDIKDFIETFVANHGIKKMILIDKNNYCQVYDVEEVERRYNEYVKE